MKSGFKRNRILGLNNANGIVGQVEEVKAELKNHFEQRFKECNFSMLKLKGVQFNSLSRKEITLLEDSLLYEEIKQVILLIDGDKTSV